MNIKLFGLDQSITRLLVTRRIIIAEKNCWVLIPIIFQRLLMNKLLSSNQARHYGLALLFLFCGTLALSGLLGFFDPFKNHHLTLASLDNQKEILLWTLRKVSWFMLMAVGFSGTLLFLDSAVTAVPAASKD
jgi:hypothetical protein